ncbi:MAG: ketopantoate reductase family protein [Oceanococcus sp.]
MSENLIIGAGAIGTVFAAYLTAARRTLRVAERSSEIDAMARRDELQVDRITGRLPLRVPTPALTTDTVPREGENVFICVKHRDLQALMDSWPEKLAAGVTLIPCLNGVGASRELQMRFPGTRIVALTIMFNAQLLEPLHARVTARPQIVLNTDRKDLLQLFDRAGVDVKRADGTSAAWGKLLINLANGICALTNTTFKDLLTRRELTRCLVALLDEAVAILDKAKIDYQLPVALPYGIYRLVLLHGGHLPWWVGRMRNNMSSGSYPSMVADVRHGQTTEVRQLNGEIVHLATSMGISAPRNLKIVELIEQLEGVQQTNFMSPAELLAVLNKQ